MSSYLWSSTSCMKNTLEVSVTSINVSENTYFLEAVLDWVSLTLTSMVEVSIFSFSRVYLEGGAGFSAETVKFEVKNVPSYMTTSLKVAIPSTTGTVMSLGMENE